MKVENGEIYVYNATSWSSGISKSRATGWEMHIDCIMYADYELLNEL